jgi:hypothetical protein
MSLAAGREASGRRRLARSNVGFVYMLNLLLGNFLRRDLVQYAQLALVVQQDCWRHLLQGGVQVFVLFTLCLCILFVCVSSHQIHHRFTCESADLSDIESTSVVFCHRKK